MQHHDLEQTSTKRLRVLVALDFTDADGAAFDRGARIVQTIPGAELHLVHVFRHEQQPERIRDLQGHLRLYVEEKAAILPGLHGVTVGIHLRSGKTDREIAALAKELDATVIVLGSHPGVHVRRWLGASLAKKLVDAVGCPVTTTEPLPAHAPAPEPVIEPPCPECARTRVATRGLRVWCDRHAHEAASGHVYGYHREIPFASHDSQVTPTGIDF